MPSAMRPIFAWVSESPVVGVLLLAMSRFLNEPGAPVSDSYTPLPGDCCAPSLFAFVPARQPTEASTAPGFAFVPFVLAFAGPWTTTSVTMLARKQSFTDGALPLQSGVPAGAFLPVGRFTFVKVAPPSDERKRPPPVAA